MMSGFGLRRMPTLAMLAAALLFLGAQNAAIYPYQSLIAIKEIGLSKPQFALLMVLASSVAVVSSVVFGILADQRANRRLLAVLTALSATIGIGLMILAPGPLSLVISHGVFLPIASGLYGQIFSLAGLATQEFGPRRDGIQAALRAAMSVSFLAMLVFWTWAFYAGAGLMSVYFGAGVAAIGMTVLIMKFWPQDGQTSWQDRPSGVNFLRAMGHIAHPSVLLRLLCLGAVSSAGLLYMVLISLIFDQSRLRDAGDVALFVGLIAGWEVPFLLLLSRLMSRVSRSAVLGFGVAVYGLQLVAMPLLVDTPLVWGLTLLAGLGGTAVIMVPIPYYQDLMAGRPGAASALLALQKLVGDVLAAGIFVVGTALGTYGLTAALGAGVALLGAAGLAFADRKARVRA